MGSKNNNDFGLKLHPLKVLYNYYTEVAVPNEYSFWLILNGNFQKL